MKLNLLKITLVATFAMFVTAEGAVARNSSRTTTTTTVKKTTTSSNKHVSHSKPNTSNKPNYKPAPTQRPTVSHNNYYKQPAKSYKHVVPAKRVPTPSKVVYTRPTPVVRAVRSVPPTTRVVRHKGVNIYINNGRYYHRNDNRYIAIAPPVGIRVNVLPFGYKIIKVMGLPYYYYNGAYYRPYRNEYEVVAPPQDIVVYTLPEEADLITMNGKSYYLYDGYLYSIVNTPNGKAFKMTGQLDFN